MHEDDVRRMLRAELSFRTRAAFLAALLLTTTFAIALLSLWLTEPRLPVRTHVAFGLLVMINMGWSAFCAWALAQRKVLYARQGVIAGRLAVLWSAVFVMGAVAAGYASGRASAGLLAALLGLLLLGAAVLVLRRATVRHQQLLRLKQSLEDGMAHA
jgi:uncharacterized membrane protein YfcA